MSTKLNWSNQRDSFYGVIKKYLMVKYLVVKVLPGSFVFGAESDVIHRPG